MAYNAEVADKIWLVSFMAILMTGVGISLWMVRLVSREPWSRLI